MCIRDSIQAEGKADRLGTRLMAIVAEGKRGRVYLPATDEHELVAARFDQDPLVTCLLYTSDAADERSSVDLGGRRLINKKKKKKSESNTQLRNKE